ncbi:transporter substrate-binding domain-containing protein [Kitasatospora sp. NPDC006697]|uniref:transporter substrate-binding domain-containing protein n=1 Tax=Kitasatospora sp. NPDC006697 TaxID=3364020 RepID=UPI0036CEEB1E
MGQRVRVLAVAGAVLVAAAGWWSAGAAPARPGATAAAPAPSGVAAARPADDPGCDPRASRYRPAEDSGGSTIQSIRAHGSLVVGVDLNDYHWGFLGPDGKPAGFDIDLVHAISQSILGRPDAVTYVALDDDQRIPRLESSGAQHVDLVVHTMTATCERARKVDFSTVYFVAGERVLVPRAHDDPNESGPAALKGRRVCVAAGSTSYDNLAGDLKKPRDQQQFQPAGIVTAPAELDCLVRVQLGLADAVLTDDAIAYGLAAQDPATMVVGDPISPEPYAIAMPPGEADLVAWVNQVLEQYRARDWQASYDKWLKPFVHGQAEAEPPAAEYVSN